MRADDIEGTRPGWRPHPLFVEQPRDPLHVADICPGPVSRTSKAGAQQQGGSRALARGTREGQAGDGSGAAGAASGGVAAELFARPAQQHGPPVPEYGVAYTVDWRKQRAEAKLRQAEAARQAQAAADAAIAAAAAKAAAAVKAGGAVQASGGAVQGIGSGSGGGEAPGTVGLAGMMKSLRTYDRDGCGFVQASGVGDGQLKHICSVLDATCAVRQSTALNHLHNQCKLVAAPQAGELAAALQQSRLGLSQGDVHHLVAAVRSPGGSVEYRPFVSKLWGQLQQQGAVPAAPPAGPGQAVPATGARAAGQGGAAAGGPLPAGAAAPVHLPQFVVARQRRLQTNVALALAQQPEATAREAADLAALPGFLPWKPKPQAQFGKRMAYERPAELGTAPSTTFTFADGDPRAAEVRVADVWDC